MGFLALAECCGASDVALAGDSAHYFIDAGLQAYALVLALTQASPAAICPALLAAPRTISW